jgi:hypothetical protein
VSFVCRWCQRENESTQLACSNCGCARGARSPVEGPPILATYKPTLTQVKKLHKEHPDLDTRTAEAVLTDIRNERALAGTEKPRMAWVPEDERHLFELTFFDAHLGKYAWGEETGEDYDTSIACRRVRSAVLDLLEQAKAYKGVEKILIPLGNDLLQTDGNNDGKTTTSGTYVDTDTRYIRTFRAARKLSSWVIHEAARIAPVQVVIVPGNHDALSCFHLGEVIDAEFANDPRVSVDNSPRPRKYLRYGATLLGFAHGHAEPHKRYPLLMPVEAPDLWAQTTQREMHVGHYHRSKVTDPVRVDGENGVRVRILSSLSGVDAWHARSGFVGEHASAEGFVWNFSRGLRANLVSTVQRSAQCSARPAA